MSEQTQQMIEYIKTRRIRRPDVHIDEDTPLVSSGLIDSLALVDILTKLEDVTDSEYPPARSSRKTWIPTELMFATAARVGKPRK